MSDFAEPLARLINEFKRLPGIGQKSAQRIAFHILRHSRDEADQLARSILDVKDKLTICTICNNISDGELCQYCRDPQRDQKVVCCVEDPNNIVGIEVTRPVQRSLSCTRPGAVRRCGESDPERSRHQKPGRPDNKRRSRESNRCHKSDSRRRSYRQFILSKLLKPLGIKVTRIAMGVPVGSDLEFADEVTMWKAMEGRREISFSYRRWHLRQHKRTHAICREAGRSRTCLRSRLAAAVGNTPGGPGTPPPRSPGKAIAGGAPVPDAPWSLMRGRTSDSRVQWAAHAPGRNFWSAAHWNHRESSAGIIPFQHSRDSDVLAHAGNVIPRHISIEVRGAINNQGFTMLLKHLLLQNGDGGGLTATVVSRSGVTTEDANSRIGRQPRIDIADGREKLSVNR